MGLRLGRPAGLSGVEQPGHLGRRQVILGALVPVGGRDGARHRQANDWLLSATGCKARHSANCLVYDDFPLGAGLRSARQLA